MYSSFTTRDLIAIVLAQKKEKLPITRYILSRVVLEQPFEPDEFEIFLFFFFSFFLFFFFSFFLFFFFSFFLFFFFSFFRLILFIMIIFFFFHFLTFYLFID